MATLAVAGHYLRRSIPQVLAQNRSSTNCFYTCCRARLFSCSTDSFRTEFTGENAYDLLGVSENSSFAETKDSFRKLAKETHPDLADSKINSTASHRFVRILAAYEILSNSEKRAHYDSYLFSQRRIMQKYSGQGTRLSMYKSHVTTLKQMEVVEWLKWYRFAISDIVSEKKVVVGTGYFDILERDFYSAIHAAYYGPVIESMDLLPDRFEAEERSAYETHEVLHLVSGRDLFGMVCLSNEVPALSFSRNEKLASFSSIGSGVCPKIEDTSIHMSSNDVDEFRTPLTESQDITDHTSDAYKDLELHISGRVVAVATRVPPKSHCNGMQNEDAQDHIYVFLSSHEDPSMHVSKQSSMDQSSGGEVVSRIPLGTITGLGTSPEEGSCFVYDSSGTKTHVIMKHRTLLFLIEKDALNFEDRHPVKHMHWYGVGEEVSVCECRCSRACLPPSKFWLFEPRCGIHDIGGWYVETFGRDKKGRTVPSQRYWGFDASEECSKRLHPAMYLLAIAYRTLDLEDVKRKKRTVRDVIEGQLFRVLSWCKKIA